MLRSKLLSLSIAGLLATSASAQFCSDNSYAATLVDGGGLPAPMVQDPGSGESYAQFGSEAVFLAFDAHLPSGTYYVHVTDDPIDGMDEVLSDNDPMDRFVTVTNTSGVITLSLPFSGNPDPSLFGLGLGGQGMSLRLAPFHSASWAPCRFKAWYGDNWDLANGPANPYLLAGGIHPLTGQCAVRSYTGFRIGSGNGSDVTGRVFLDADHDGVRDANEGGLGGWQVSLVDGATSLSATTDGNGNYAFHGIAAGAYSLELGLQSNYTATTPAAQSIQVCSCADLAAEDFGVATEILPCNARPLCYWVGCHGLQKVQQFGVLATLPALCLRNGCGQHVAPGNLCQFKWYLLCANAWNMAYALSAEVVVMQCNLLAGFVHPDCVVDDPCLGQVTVAQLMQQAVMSLCAHGNTTPCSPWRSQQDRLRRALYRANRNQIWM